jgi:glycosyltransferase involved in cell wall biosynthesis
MKILFFIGSLRSGGKERRLIELLTNLKNINGIDALLVTAFNKIDYNAFYKLGIKHICLNKKANFKDPKLFFNLHKICKLYKPDIIHAWGGMQAFYSIPTSIVKRIPLVNSQITSAPPKINKLSFSNLINQVNFRFSDAILSNSRAGLEVYNSPKHKSKVIYNGINPDRFVNLPAIETVKKKYGISTHHAVVMVASFSQKKDFDLFYRLAGHITRLRDDITFIGAGGPTGDGAEYTRLKSLARDNPRIIFPGWINEVEVLVNACDVGMLFSPNGEGLSNSILEYMALGKPVIASDAGGTKELVRHNQNGYLVTNESIEEIGEMIIELIDNPQKRTAFGKIGKKIVEESFTLEKMGMAFEKVYREVLSK